MRKETIKEQPNETLKVPDFLEQTDAYSEQERLETQRASDPDIEDHAEPSPPLEINERWLILEKLGMGGMSAVYKARHRITGQLAAVKILLPHHSAKPESLRRFQSEAMAISKLDHPHIIGLHDCGTTDDGQVFVVMDYADGRSLAQELDKNGILPLERALQVFLQISDALAHAHKRGIIHRDLKPSNVMLLKEQDRPDYLKLVDFGIAKLIHAPDNADAEAQRLTATGEVFGSPLYMSPEQYQGQVPDERSDIYSMGCLMYEVVTGSPPFIGKNPLETLYKHVTELPAPILLDPDGDPALKSLESIIFKCLGKNRSERYQSMTDLHADLERVASNRPASVRLIRRPEKKTFGLLQMATLSLLIVAGLVWCFYAHFMSDHDEKEKQRLQAEKFSEIIGDNRIEHWSENSPDSGGKDLADLNAQLEQSTDNGQLYIDRGCVYMFELNEPPNAVRDFDRGIALNIEDASAYADRAYAHAAMNNFDLALADAHKSIEIETGWAGGYAALAHVENSMEKFDDAFADSKRARALDPLTSSIIAEGAYSKYGSENYVEALEWYNDAFKAYETAENLAFRGLTKLQLGDQTGALVDEQNAVDLDTTSAVAQFGLAFAQQSNRNNNAAEHLAEKGVALDRIPERAHRWHGELYRVAGAYEHAIAEFGKSIALDPDSYRAYRSRGICYLRLGQLHNALEDLQQAVNRNQTSAISLSYLAVVQQELDDKTGADASLAKALANSPTSECFSNSASVHLARSELNLAIADAEQAIRLNPRNASAWHVCGLSWMKLGEHGKAYPCFNKAKEYNYPEGTPRIE